MYPLEFCCEAVRLGVLRRKSIARIATKVSLGVEMLHSWVKQEEIDAEVREGQINEEREELRHLRPEMKALLQEKETLRKVKEAFSSLFSPGKCSRLYEPLSVCRLKEIAHCPVSLLCKMVGISKSGYYAWTSRSTLKRSHEDSTPHGADYRGTSEK